MEEARATDRDVADSMAAFRTKDRVKLRFIAAALSTISTPPSSMVLRYVQGFDGGAGAEAPTGGGKENGHRVAPLKALSGDTFIDRATSGRGASGGSAPARPLVRDPGQGAGTKEGPVGAELLARSANIGDEAGGGAEFQVRGDYKKVGQGILSRAGVYGEHQKGAAAPSVIWRCLRRGSEGRRRPLGDLEERLHHARATGNTTASDLGVDSLSLGANCIESPLIFHDLDIVRASWTKLGRGQLDLSQQITCLLQKCPGPIKYFRLDSSVFGGGSGQIHKWLEILKSKSIEAIVMVNCNWPEESVEFPIQQVGCQSIQRLQLCFYSISISDLNMFEASKLSMIDIAHCKITVMDLFELVRQCRHLKELDIGIHSGNVLIHSESLEVIQVWWSEVTNLTVLLAPKLRKITVGVAASDAAFTTAITITGAPVLRHVWFNLSSQSFMIDGYRIEQEHSCIPNLRVLELTMACRKAEERKSLLNFLKSCIFLRELILWRVDDASLSEETDVARDDLFGKLERMYCINTQLEVLSLKDYRGGQVEDTIASAVLRYATKLRILNMITSSGNPSSSAVLSKAKQVLRCVYRPFPPAELNLYEDKELFVCRTCCYSF